MLAAENVNTKVETFSLAAGQWEEDVLGLLKTILAHPSNYVGETVDTVMGKLACGYWRGWVIEGKGIKLLMLTEVQVLTSGDRQLFLVGLAGKGLMRGAREVLTQLERIMQEFGCSFLQVHTASPAVTRLLRQLKFTPLTQLFLRVKTNG